MSKLLVTSDWHLGIRQFGLDIREQDFYDSAWNLVTQSAKDNACNIILNAGDIFDSIKPSVRSVHALAKINQFLIDNQMSMYYIEGNHDKTIQHWTNTVNFTPKDNYGIILLEDGRPYNIDDTSTLFGFSFEADKEVLLEKINNLQLDPARKNILMIHISCKEFTGMDFTGNGFSIYDIKRLKEFDYIIIGDTHKHMQIQVDKSLVLSPGSIELCSSAEDLVKYVYVIDTNPVLINKALDLRIKTRNCYFIDTLDTSKLNMDQEMQFLVKKFNEDIVADSLVYLYYTDSTLGLEQVKSICKEKNIILRSILRKASDNKLAQNQNTQTENTSVSDIVAYYQNVYNNADINPNLNNLILSCLDPEQNAKEQIINYIQQGNNNGNI